MLTLLWAGVAAYIVFAAFTVRARRAEQKVTKLTINITDSTSQGHLISGRQVREWLQRGGIKTVGMRADAVNLAGIEELIGRNGFVDHVKAYVTYQGELRIGITQRRPVVRILLNGYDSYVTSDGYVFPAPRSSSVYVPVVTGPYRPSFSASYAGSVRRYTDDEKRRIDERIAAIDKEKYPYYRRERQNDENLRALRRMRVKKGWFENDETYDRRVQELRKEKELLRRRYRYEERLVEEGIAAVEEKQAAERREQKKSEKNYEDFTKLITFVRYIEQDEFWRSEVVQIIAETSVSGALEVTIIPRSGNHVVLFGRIEDMEAKFNRLMRFYKGGFNKLGWDTYRVVDVRYAGQVVCRK